MELGLPVSPKGQAKCRGGHPYFVRRSAPSEKGLMTLPWTRPHVSQDFGQPTLWNWPKDQQPRRISMWKAKTTSFSGMPQSLQICFGAYCLMKP